MLDTATIALLERGPVRCRRSSLPPGVEREDLRQDLRLHCLQRMPRFDPGRASLATFIDRVASNRASSLVARAFAQKRDCRRTVALDPGGQGTAHAIEAMELGRSIGADARLAADRAHLRVEIERILPELPAALARFARLLAQGESVTQAAGLLGISRATGYRRVSHLRYLFAECGLDAYRATPGRADGE
jgi:RNA polymerase sigma factor (sigma-70 family)